MAARIDSSSSIIVSAMIAVPGHAAPRRRPVQRWPCRSRASTAAVRDRRRPARGPGRRRVQAEDGATPSARGRDRSPSRRRVAASRPCSAWSVDTSEDHEQGAPIDDGVQRPSVPGALPRRTVGLHAGPSGFRRGDLGLRWVVSDRRMVGGPVPGASSVLAPERRSRRSLVRGSSWSGRPPRPGSHCQGL
jgi:hypothetical protein